MVWLDIIRAVIDIGIVTLIFYTAFMRVRGTKVISILKGVAFILVVWLVSGVLGFETLKFLTSQLLVYGILGLLILFQPELRQMLEKIGKKGLVASKSSTKKEETVKIIDSITDAVDYMSKRNIGALINIEMGDTLQEFVQTGIKIDASISKELIQNIFSPNVPLHDGAMIIQEGRIASASCYLPLSEDDTISKELGTRHRAAIGLSEVADALTVVVSEETGDISLSRNAKLLRGITLEELRNHLEMALVVVKEKPKTNTLLRGAKK